MMIPPFAAVSAINTIDKVGSGAISQLKHLGSAGHAAGSKNTGATSESFASLLAAHGVNSSGVHVSPAAPPVRQG
jgi:hypothetical protein